MNYKQMKNVGILESILVINRKMKVQSEVDKWGDGLELGNCRFVAIRVEAGLGGTVMNVSRERGGCLFARSQGVPSQVERTACPGDHSDHCRRVGDA